jgi:hypothetical protein
MHCVTMRFATLRFLIALRSTLASFILSTGLGRGAPRAFSGAWPELLKLKMKSHKTCLSYIMSSSAHWAV